MRAVSLRAVRRPNENQYKEGPWAKRALGCL